MGVNFQMLDDAGQDAISHMQEIATASVRILDTGMKVQDFTKAMADLNIIPFKRKVPGVRKVFAGNLRFFRAEGPLTAGSVVFYIVPKDDTDLAP